ncbi:hypothetical protein TRIATDRAFT_308259 [Trichoderma atroviride IMI 206040]|uniref:Uncharacterized protein n=1 Tax=Hypocrea atroviridis (strain ATCC 20476 / IMI 206040) TaxID=452589 RepID=G9NX36_HYPAI|nr:uncharacterized protein TRIATDRAFT_308259 [Trichoderma atroviride IMI 206040]EHK44688.1 hypothetical protein TRIATDRAFT_308259 [Trichoderma atroviride IMI 206040]
MSSPVSTPDAETTPAEFLLFGNLPAEIRLSIWKNAARSARPGVHIFGGHWMGEADSDGPIDLALVPPRIQDASGVTWNWVGGNPSTYNRDFGLWMASYESRSFMLRHYQHLEDAITEEKDAGSSFSGRSHLVDLGGDHVSRVFPNQDLLCLQPLETSPGFGDLPFFRNDSPIKVKNLALEYDPAWMNGLVQAQTNGARERARADLWREDSRRGVFIRSLWAMAERTGPANMTLWLVDSSLRQREMPSNAYMPGSDDNDDTAKDPQKAEPKPREFHSLDTRCVEVKDLSECKYDALKPSTAFHFLHELQINVGFNVGWMIDRQAGQNPTPIPNGLEDLVKVLCIEPN